MTTASAAQLRRLFLDFFAQHEHQVVSSAPVIPQNDPTLMFTNAGMVQFKDVFVGLESRPYTRAASSQKCIRVSGKHNDLEEVGRTARHHTFFEMLGNFSFGDYFKERAIELAWKFIVEELNLPKERLWVTVFGGADGLAPDTDARSLWRKISGLPDERIVDMGMKDNFWAMGDTGPCGPCTEIHYDIGDKHAPSVTMADFESGRVLEFWNNVFMQFERTADGELTSLPRPSVDTGMGLERLVAIAQGVPSNYDTDVFSPLLSRIAEDSSRTYGRSHSEDDVSMRVIADHARTTSFLVADGVQPSNEGRGYVMRRIMRRAIRHVRRLGFDDIFFPKVCDAVVLQMGDAFPELHEARALIEKVVGLEEQNFRRTLDTGLGLLADEIDVLRESEATIIPGTTVFKLYDTYGFPKDLTEVIAQESGLAIDEPGFLSAMEAQRSRSRGELPGGDGILRVYKTLRDELGETPFTGYPHESLPLGERDDSWRFHEADDGTHLQVETKVAAILRDGKRVDRVEAGACEVVFVPTPLYGESGGQVGDRGRIDGLATGSIIDTKKPSPGLTVSQLRVESGELKVGDSVWAGYHVPSRVATRAHHSATHLLHAALREILGEHVKQAGSLVDAGHLRFDYSHFESLTPAELRGIEKNVNDRVAAASEVKTEVLPFDEAKKRGAIAMFGEKYGETVRVLTMGSSIEFCGGTHVSNTEEIGHVLILKDESVASGVRRIEAEVGSASKKRVESLGAELEVAASVLNEFSQTAPSKNDSQIILAMSKAVQTYFAVMARLGSDKPKPPEGWPEIVEAPVFRGELSLDSALLIRDLWNAMTRLSNCRGAEAKDLARAILEESPELGAGGLLATYALLVDSTRTLERKASQRQDEKISGRLGDILAEGQSINGMELFTANFIDADQKSLRTLVDKIRDQSHSAVIALTTVNGSKVTLIVALTKNLTKAYKAGELVRELAPFIEGRGGGKPDMAQAGGSNPDGIPAAMRRLQELLSDH